MHPLKRIILGLLFAGALFAVGVVASNRRAATTTAPRDQTAASDPTVMSQIARAQATAALSQASGAVSLLPGGR
jgi:hypothetical protein